jgi:glutamyl-tRNA synthetase
MSIDTLRIAIVNYLVAKQQNLPFTVRIDDTDKTRIIEGKDTEFMQILEKFSLIHDNVFHQSEHLHMHQTLAIRLLQEGKAFVCTCQTEKVPYSGKCMELDSREYARLKESGEPFVIRLKKPETPVIIHDMICGKMTASPDEVDSLVILNTDSTPTGNFASACDDMLSGVSFVITDANHTADTLKQVHIKQMLGFDEETRYAHLPTIENNEEVLTLQHLFEEGFIPDAIINYLLLLGYEDTPQEIFTLPEALSWFELEKFTTLPIRHDIEKLRMINQEHLKQIDDKRLSTLFGFADADIGKLAKLYLDEAYTLKELEASIRPFFSPKDFNHSLGDQMRKMQKIIFDAPMIQTFDTFETYMMQKSGLEGDTFSKTLRMLLTGRQSGPDLSKIYPYIKSYLLEVVS